MIKYLENSNLPQGDVKHIIAQIDDEQLLNELRMYGINIIETSNKMQLEPFVNKHADVLIYYLGNGNIIVDSSQKNIISSLKNLNFNVKEVNGIYSPYPFDCSLNCCDIGDFIICNSNITNEKILNFALKHNKKIINTKQGYSKCSICVVRRNTIITDDDSIYSAVSNIKDISSLKIKKGSIHLKNCNYGFIGGCSGLIGKDKLFFNGDITKHTDFKAINDFLHYHNVKYFYIKNKHLTDIGSIIPITERV